MEKITEEEFNQAVKSKIHPILFLINNLEADQGFSFTEMEWIAYAKNIKTFRPSLCWLAKRYNKKFKTTYQKQIFSILRIK